MQVGLDIKKGCVERDGGKFGQEGSEAAHHAGILRLRLRMTDEDFGARRLVGVFGARGLDAGYDADAEEDDGDGDDVVVRNMHQVGEVGDAKDEDEITEGINSKGHGTLRGEAVECLP